jgi:apolipoprotein N-acyltransferase
MLPGGPHDEESVQATVNAGIYRLYERDGQQHRLAGDFFSVAVRDLQERVGVPLLVGAETARGLTYAPDGSGGVRVSADSRHNSALLFQDGRITGERYDKLHLTPFGEVMPLISRWDWLERQLLALGAGGMTFDLAPGPGPRVIEVVLPEEAGEEEERAVRIATPICFEATMSRICRRLVFDRGKRRADLMINLTNDGWFGGFDAGRRQHMQLARWRCLELSTPMIRAANTGISAFIDANGRVLASGIDAEGRDARVAGVLSGSIPTGFRSNTYAVIGDLVGWVALLLSVLLVGASMIGVRLGAGRRS